MTGDRSVTVLARACGIPCVWVKTTDADFDTHLPRAKGRRLVIACVGDDLVLPAAYRERYLPALPEDFVRVRAESPAGEVRRALDDGTRVILLYAPDLDAMRGLVERLALR